MSLLLVAPAAQAASAKHPRRPNTVLYQVRQDATPAQLAALSQALQERGFHTLRKMLKGKLLQAEASSPARKTEEELAAEIKATGAVDFAELDGIESPALVPNDPLYSSQWHLPKINALTAWNTTTGNNTVIVAVCDTGVEATHPDLSANLLLPGYNSADGSTNTAPAVSHGTLVAGIIGAVGNNGTGVAGVNWSVKILPVRVTNDTNAGTASCGALVAGVEYAADQGAKVVNVSYEIYLCPYAMESAAQYLVDKGGLLFVAIGNNSSDESSLLPAFSNFAYVGATDQNDALATFSNYGSPVSLVAPGVNIETTMTGGTYSTASGTSMATAVASGAAALLFALRSTFTPAQVQNFLYTTAASLGSSNFFGHGRIDIGAAVAAAQSVISGANTAPTVATTASASPNPATGTTVNLSVLGADSAGEANLTYAWAPTGSMVNTITFSQNATNAAKNTTAIFTKSGSFPLRVTITDAAGLSVTSNVSVTLNQAMTAISVYPSAGGVQAGTQQTFVATALDQFGYPLGTQPLISWTVSGGGSISGSGVFSAGASAGGPYLVTATNSGVTGIAYLNVTATSSGVAAPGYVVTPLSNIDSVAYGKLARSSDGTIHAAYARTASGGWRSLFYAYSKNGGQTWTEEPVATGGGTSGYDQENATLGVDGSGNVHVAWHTMNTTTFAMSVNYRQRNNGTWLAPEPVFPEGVAYQDPGTPQLLVDSAGNIDVAVAGQDRKRTSGTSGTWQTPQSWAGGCGGLVAFDAGDNLHTFDGLHHCIRAAAGGSWQSELVPHISTTDLPTSAAMAIDAGNNVHVAWAQGGWDINASTTVLNTSTGFQQSIILTNVVYSKRSAATNTWSAPEVVSDAICPPNGNLTAIAVDGAGNPYVIWLNLGRINNTVDYTGDSENIWIRERTSSGWQSPMTVTDLHYDQANPNLLWTFDPVASGAHPGIPQTGFALIYRASLGSPNQAIYNLMYDPSPGLTWASSSGGSSPCDVNKDNATNVVDVQLEVNQALGVTACTADINKDGVCNVIDVQRVTNAALGGQCVSP